MKRYSGVIAATLLLFVVLACNLSKNGNNSNSSNNSNSNSNKNSNTITNTRPANAEIYVEDFDMAKDKGGDPGETTTTFSPSDRTIHAVATLNKAKAGTEVKFVWKAVDVAGSKNEEIKTIEYSTKSFENKVHGHLTLPYDWPKGTYQVDIFINGALDKSLKYTIE
jgi:hypothetical protein